MAVVSIREKIEKGLYHSKIEYPVPRKFRGKCPGCDTRYYPPESDSVKFCSNCGQSLRELLDRQIEDRKAQRILYFEDRKRLEEEFKKDLFTDLNLVGHPKAELLYAKAYQLGQSSGYTEIYNYMIELEDLIR
jgi:hypothetical protein